MIVKPLTPPPDQSQRDFILSRLDANVLVEAAAGTGKTTVLVGRMIALLAAGVCQVGNLAAVTFTRKAAAEMRARFQAHMEKAARTAEGPAAERLAAAAERLDQCFIGTIHSFCARLLRERPVEAGVAIPFRELEDDEDTLLRQEAWAAFVAGLYGSEDAALGELPSLGMEITELAAAFDLFADYPDITAWPTEPARPPAYEATRRTVEEYLEYIRSLIPDFPAERGNDKLMDRHELVSRLAARADLSRPRDLFEVVTAFDHDPNCIQKCWPSGPHRGKAEAERWATFREEVARPFVRDFLNLRYAAAIPLLERARAVYDDLRMRQGALNFQDLLLKTRALLRDHPRVRAYFRRRWTHLLVDEFQDTDPLQAEIMVLLTAENVDERDWRRCRPTPGTLVVVGDPKQSIYRFRRADIVTYEQVRAIFENGGGAVVALSANFRSDPAVITWVNDVFANGDDGFPVTATAESPAYVPLQPGRTDYREGALRGIAALTVPEESSGTNEAAASYDAAVIADFIDASLAESRTVTRTEEELAAIGAAARPADFLILTRTTRRLAVYARALQDAHIPHQVTGGGALNRLEELALLKTALAAVLYPENPVALVATLRSELFGVSDAALYAFRRAGGLFDYRAPLPTACGDGDELAAIGDALERLRTYAHGFRRFPAAVALERMAFDLGLPALAAAANGGNLRTGALLKALELVRGSQAESWSTAGTADYLNALLTAPGRSLRHDAAPARAEEGGAVRIMNLHKAKGLEAPVVFLADPAGARSFDILVDIDRRGDEVLGYLRITTVNAFGNHRVIAEPPGWEDLAAGERRFVEAEEVRLRYVAATRARAQLVVSQRAKSNRHNPWSPFEPYLREAAAINAASPGTKAPQPEAPAPTIDVAAACALTEQRRHKLTTPTYETATAKKVAVEDNRYYPAAGEHGTEFGTAVHALLQALARDSAADLAMLARAIAKELDLPSETEETAVATARRAFDSEIWRRAQVAARRFAELPYQRAVAPPPGGRPALERGVIDLVFQEPDGWVIVDYKTDPCPSGNLEPLIAKYRPQLEAYKTAWETGGAGRIKETGLYFVSTGDYVTINV